VFSILRKTLSRLWSCFLSRLESVMVDYATEKEYMETVGHVVQNASHTDMLLFSTFKNISGCELEVAKAIFYPIDAITLKERILRRVATEKCTDQQKKLVEKIISNSKVATKQRNELVHAMVSPDIGSTILRRRSPRHPTVPATHAYLQSKMDLGYEAADECTDAYNDLCDSLGVPQEAWTSPS